MSTFQPLLEVIDAFPGSGKTFYFVKAAHKMLRSKKSSPYIFLYVAPTKALLSEVVSRLRGVGSGKLHTIWSADDDDFTDIPSRDVARILSSANPYTKSSGVVHHLGGLLDPSSRTAASPGSVILTTYAAFLKLPPPKPQDDTRKVWVFFDEARKCLGVRRTVSMPVSGVFPLLHLYDPKVYEEEYPSGWVAFKITRPATTAQLAALATRNGHSQAYDGAASNQMISYLQQADYTRSTQHLMVNLKGVDLPFLEIKPGVWKVDLSQLNKPKKGLSAQKISLYPFMKPTRMFDGYERVTMLSAFFKHSQMYHMLKQQSYRMVDLIHPSPETLRHIEKSPRLTKAYQSAQEIRVRSTKLRKDLQSRLTLVPLLSASEGFKPSDFDDPLPLKSQRRLTKNLLSRGLITAPEVVTKVNRLVKEAKVGWGTYDLLAHVWNFYYYYDSPFLSPSKEEKSKMKRRDDLFDLKKELYLLLKPFMVKKDGTPRDPLDILLKKGLDWILQNNPDLKWGMATPPLTVLNSRLRPIPYMPVIASGKCQTLWKKSALIADTLDEAHQKWGPYLTLTDGPYLNGLNQWLTDTYFIHLAALNPPLDVVRLYKKALPEYNPDYDHVLENLIQTVYRTNLRVPFASAPIHMILSHEELAHSLCHMLKRNFRIEPPSLNLTELRIVTKSTPTRTKAEQSRVNTLRSYWSRYKARAAAGDDKAKEKFKEVDRELRQLGWKPQKRRRSL